MWFNVTDARPAAHLHTGQSDQYVNSCYQYVKSCDQYVKCCDQYVNSCDQYVKSCNQYVKTCDQYVNSQYAVTSIVNNFPQQRAELKARLHVGQRERQIF